MDTISFTHARRHLAGTMDRVCQDRTAVIITHRQQEPVVMLSLTDYQALEETAHLLRSPANARRLLASVRELETGGGRKQEFPDGPDHR
jgi:antitoxin YefM